MKAIKKIRVIAADDHDVYLDGLTMLFNRSKEIELVATADNGRKLMDLSKKLKPDVVLTDINMSVLDGIAATRLIADIPKSPPVIVISAFDTKEIIGEAFDAGAMGFIIKNAERGEIISAVKKVHEGFPYYCKITTGILSRIFANTKYDPYAIAINYRFDAQEKEIIRMVCMEKTNKEIGYAMCQSPRTIEGLRSKIMLKMNVQSMAGFTIYALKHQLFKFENMREIR